MAEQISKQEAVRRALAHFGNDAKPAQMQGWIKSEFGIEMGADHISTAKGEILRKAGVKRKRGKKKPGRPKAGKPSAAVTVTSAPVAAPARAKAGGIALDDILSVKALLGRVGPDQLHKLIDALAP
jgi:hypothetical protein